MADTDPSHMRAVVLEAPGRAVVRQVPVPQPAAQEVLIAVEGCGICGSSVPVWQGRPWFQYPLPPGAPGHEGWGRIARSSGGYRAGERVCFLSERALAEYAVVRASAVCRLPESLAAQPFPGEAFACVMNVFRRARVHRGERVAVVGAGFIGAGIIALCAHTGAEVVAISRRPWALRLAQQLGAARAVGMRDGDDTVEREVVAFSAKDGCDVVIEAVGEQHTLSLASRLVRTRGRLVIAGFHQDGQRQVDMQAWNWRGIDVINAHERDPAVYVHGMRAAADAVATGLLDPKQLVTHTFDFAHAGDAFTAMQQRPDGFLKAVVRP